MFLLVPDHPGSPEQRAVKWLLLSMYMVYKSEFIISAKCIIFNMYYDGIQFLEHLPICYIIIILVLTYMDFLFVVM